MTKIIKHLRSVEDIKNELKENPENIKYYMGYMGYESQYEGSIDYVEEKIKEYKNKQNENKKN
jgi:predicted phosphoadenosine phosphosulfate sulfurtransferase